MSAHLDSAADITRLGPLSDEAAGVRQLEKVEAE
jgi:hypothetical protein